FFRALMRQWPQGLWVVTPAGRVLGFHYHKSNPGESYADGQRRWVRDTETMITNAIRDAGPLTPRGPVAQANPLADRGHGTAADGGVRLAVSVVRLRGGRKEGPPAVDSIPLTVEQWRAFRLPAGDVKAGREWTIPEEAGRRFAPALSPMTDAIFSPIPDDVTLARVTARVERVADRLAVVRYTGRWE